MSRPNEEKKSVDEEEVRQIYEHQPWNVSIKANNVQKEDRTSRHLDKITAQPPVPNNVFAVTAHSDLFLWKYLSLNPFSQDSASEQDKWQLR